MTLVDGILANDVSTIFDVHDLDDHEQQLVVAAICDALVRLPERIAKEHRARPRGAAGVGAAEWRERGPLAR
jgi:hypothetical protein